MGRWFVTILLAVGLGVLVSRTSPALRAQDASGVPAAQSQSHERPAPAPTLARLSEETQALYQEVRPGIIRIHLPPTYWPQHSENPLEKWKEKLDPDVRQKIAEAQARSAAAGAGGGGANLEVNARIQPSTQPADKQTPGATNSMNPTNASPATQPTSGTLVASIPAPRLQVSPRMDGGLELLAFSSSAGPYDAEMPSPSLKVIGLLLDESGHVLVPLYIERGAIGDEPLRVSGGDGNVSTATFVGSDRQTNLTVLKLTKPIGRPVRVSGARPADGSLVMVLSPAGHAGALSVWAGGQQDRGIVVTMDGGVAGFARYGQFLSGTTAQPVVDQLVRFGRVKRATLGVLVEETETPDGRRAMRIEKVMPDAPAEQVGLRADDYILSMGGAPVNDLPSFAAAIAAHDGETQLEILRGEKTFTVTVILKSK